MKKRSFLWLLYLLIYVGLAAWLTVIILRREAGQEHPPERKGHIKPADRLSPGELFFLDRNYPSYDAHEEQYLAQLRTQQAHDRATPRSRRGLDHPWTTEGPGNLGGRINTIAVHPGDSLTIYLGYSQGGIFRTRDGGATWNPVFDDQPSLSIGHIALDPHAPDRVWAATGDVNISGYPHIGSGLYRSDDGGDTWTWSGLGQTGVLSKIIPDPHDPDILYAGAMGFPSRKGPERGLYRSDDGGASWAQTLFIDDSTGVIDIVADPTRPGRVFASGWTRLRTNKLSRTTGPGTGLYRSDDYGLTWTNVQQGLPEDDHSRTSVDVAKDGTLFLSYIGTVSTGECTGYIESLQQIYRSEDGGMSWDTVPAALQHGVHCDLFGQFGWYFEALKVNPDNADDIFLLGVDMYRSLDGGISWFEATPPWWTYEVHADKHDLIFAHGNLYLATDGGAYRSAIDGFGIWEDIENIPATQFYRTAWSPHEPDRYFGGSQDNGTSGGHQGMINEWPRILGGDGFQPLFDPTEPAWMYALTQYGSVFFRDEGGFKNINKGLSGNRYWDMPLVMSPHDPKTLFCGSSQMYVIHMDDAEPEWAPMSPDLTRGETILGNRYPALTAIAQSPVDAQRIYAGTQDGLLWTSPDGGASWVDITEGTPGNFVTSITCSALHPDGVFVTFSGYRDGDHQPYIFQSLDAGAGWFPLATNIPTMGVNTLMILPETDEQTLLIATDGGVYVSFDAGVQWERVGSSMPYMPVFDLDYNPVTRRLVAATFSRGLMTFPVDELEVLTGAGGQAGAADAFRLYPTVTTSSLWLERSGEVSGIQNTMDLTIHASTGAVVFTRRWSPERRAEITLPEGLPAGYYLMRLAGAGREQVLPFFKL